MKRSIVVIGLLIVTLGTGCSVTDSISSLKTRAVNKANDKATNVLSGEQNHTVIVPGYGAPVAGNRTYEQYIESVADFVEDETNGVNAVVFTGSYSTLKDTSEAESMNAYFNTVVDTSLIRERGIRVYKEECAIVSWQNVSYTRDLLAADSIVPSKVTLFGDVNREDKLVAFAAYAFNEDINVPDSVAGVLEQGIGYTEVDFRGFSFGNNLKDDERERQVKFAAEIAGAYDPALGNEILGKRITDWTAEFKYDVAQNLVEKGCSQFSGF